MKLLSCYIFIICFSITLNAQTIVTQTDIGGTHSEFNSVVLPTDDGGFVVAGRTYSGETGSFIETSISPAIVTNELWIYLVKYAADYTVQWQKSFGGDDGNSNDGSSLGDFIRTSDGGWMIAGLSSTQPSFGNKTAPSYGGNDFWAIKLDNNFNIQWQNSYGGSGDDDLAKVTELADGSFLLAGISNSPISGTKTDTCRGNADYWLVKIDANGNQLWDKTMGSTQMERLEGLAVSSNGNITLSGNTYSDTATNIPSGERTMTYGMTDFWVISLDATGTILWNKTLGGGGDEDDYLLTTGCLFTDGNNYYVGGSSPKESISAPTMRTAPRKGVLDAWLVKLDNNGNVLWDKSYGGDTISYQNITREVSIDGSTNILIAGFSDSDAANDKSENSRGGNDFWLLKIDTAGNLLWDKTIGGSLDDESESIFAIDSVTYLVSGFSKSGISGDKTSANFGIYDTWTLEISSTNLGIKTQALTEFKLYPNPSTTSVTISGKSLNELQTIVISDLTGKIVSNIAVTSNATNELTIPVEQLPTGTYFVRLIGNSYASTYKVVKD